MFGLIVLWRSFIWFFRKNIMVVLLFLFLFLGLLLKRLWIGLMMMMLGGVLGNVVWIVLVM